MKIMGIFSKLFVKDKKGLVEADKQNQEYLKSAPVAQDNEENKMRAASSALTGGDFPKASLLYHELAEEYPQNKGLYLSQVGVAKFFLNEYEEAIKYYLQAKDNGADNNMMDDNIWEACEALYNKAQDKQYIQKYMEYFPNGSYVKKANKILSK